MAEYIDKKEAIKELREVYENEYPTASGDFDEYASHDVPNVLRNMKAADVQPVKRGRWIMHSDYPDKIICSHCNSACDAYFCERDSMKYCPNCGARMEED